MEKISLNWFKTLFLGVSVGSENCCQYINTLLIISYTSPEITGLHPMQFVEVRMIDRCFITYFITYLKKKIHYWRNRKRKLGLLCCAEFCYYVLLFYHWNAEHPCILLGVIENALLSFTFDREKKKKKLKKVIQKKMVLAFHSRRKPRRDFIQFVAFT